MAREIKFRAFDKMLNRYLFDGDGFHPIGEFTIFNQVERYCEENRCGFKTIIERIGHIELMQFTGLKDKNDVDIYDGDIWGNVYGLDLKATVIFHEGRWALKWSNGSAGDLHAHVVTKSGEVIGNIHQHRHLLE